MSKILLNSDFKTNKNTTSTSNVIKHVKKYPEPALDTSLFGNSEPEEKFRNAYYDLER